MIAALALVLGISQCKKQENPVASGEKQHIVLNASFGDSNAKIDEDGTGGLKWAVGDLINVSKDGQSLSDEGLICTDAAKGIFEGEITETTGQITFTFCRANFKENYMEQTGELNDAISLTAEAPYDKNGNYNVMMNMPHAVLKLDVSALGTTGNLEIKAGGAKVASVTNISDPTAVFVAVPANGNKKEYKISIGSKIAIKTWRLLPNTFYTKSDGAGGGTGEAIVIKPIPASALPGLFTIRDGKQVYFSKGNLWYNGSVFHFEENQWGYESYNLTTHVSYFYWCKNASVACASSYNDASATPNDVLFTNESSFQVSEETAGMWRTLSIDEWTYLLNTNNASSNARTDANRFAKAKVKNVNGLLIFPDGYNDGTAISNIEGVAAVNNIAVGYPTSSIKDSDWADMESSGVVFLPAAGNHRDDYYYFSIGTHCNYWSSSTYATSNDAYFLVSNPGEVRTQDHITRSRGYAVRLVSEI